MTSYDLLIIGAGPAGIAASVYAARKRLNTILVSQNIGGQINKTMGIENYLGYQFIEAPELIEKFETQMDRYPIEQVIGENIERLDRFDGGFEAFSDSGKSYRARAAILATGKMPRQLGVPGETEYTGRGVTYCAICDGPIFAGKKVAVVGGGNSALEAALDMVKLADHVYLVSLTPLTGDAVLIEKLSDAKNLTVLTGYKTEKVEGDVFVQALLITEVESSKERRLEVGGVFVEIGLIPNAGAVSHLIRLNELGEVPVNCNCETEVPGLFAAGDVTSVPEKQIIIAAGEGAKACLQANRYLQRTGK